MKKLLALVLALTMLATLSAGQLALADEGVTLDVWYSCWVSQEDKAKTESEWTINKLVDQFEAETGINVNMVFYSDQQVAQNKLKAAVLAGDAPDIVNIYSGYVINSLADVMLDITDKVPAEDREHISGWAAVTVDDRYLGYPVSFNEACNILYNKEIVKAAGVELEGENAPKNAEELWQAMQKIKDSGHQVFVAGDSGYNSLFVMCFSAWWSQMSGVASITSDSLSQTKFSEDKGFLTALQYCADVYANGFVNQDYEACADAMTRFMNGEAAFFAGSTVSKDILNAMGDNLGVFMIPDYSADVAFPGYQIGGAGQAMCVLKSSEHPDEAIKFLSYLSSHDVAVELLGGDGFTLRDDVGIEELGCAGVPLYERYLELINTHTFNWNDNSMQTDVMNEFYAMSTMAVTGQISVEECAAQLDTIAADVAGNS